MAIETFRQAAKRYKIASESISKVTMKVLDKYGNIAVGICKDNTNVITGYGRRSWRLEKAHKVADLIQAFVCNDVQYMFWVNNGHKKINGGWVEGQFITNYAFSRIESKIALELEKELRVLIETGKKR